MADKTENYISLQDATQYCNYSQDYLGLRARQGKLKAIKLGRNWVTKKEWLEEYVAKTEEYKNNLSATNGRTTNGENKRTVLPISKSGEQFSDFSVPFQISVQAPPPENLPFKILKIKKVVFFKERVFNFFRLPSFQFSFYFSLAIVLIFSSFIFGKDSFGSVSRDVKNIKITASQGLGIINEATIGKISNTPTAIIFKEFIGWTENKIKNSKFGIATNNFSNLTGEKISTAGDFSASVFSKNIFIAKNIFTDSLKIFSSTKSFLSGSIKSGWAVSLNLFKNISDLVLAPWRQIPSSVFVIDKTTELEKIQKEIDAVKKKSGVSGLITQGPVGPPGPVGLRGDKGEKGEPGSSGSSYASYNQNAINPSVNFSGNYNDLNINHGKFTVSSSGNMYTAGSLALGGDTISDFTGTGLAITNGALGVQDIYLSNAGDTASGNYTFSGLLSVSSLTINSAFSFPGDDGSAGQVIKTDGSGSLSWVDLGSATVAGSNGQVQYNNGGIMAGASGLTWNNSTSTLSILSVVSASTSSATNFSIGGDTITDFTGTRLSVTGGVLNADTDLHNYSWTNVTDADIPNAITVTGYMQDTDIDTLAELNTWITDGDLLALAGGTMTGNIAFASGKGIYSGYNMAEDTGLYFTDGGIMLKAGNENRMNITISGDVGIGTAGPDRKLDILTTSSAQLRLTYTDNSVYTDFFTDSSGNLTITPTGGSVFASKLIGGSSTTSDLYLQTTSGVGTTGADIHFLVGSNGGTEAMTILNSGNVGMGTATSDRKLDILDATNPQLKLSYADNTIYGEMQVDGNGDLLITSTGGDTLFGDGLAGDSVIDLYSTTTRTWSFGLDYSDGNAFKISTSADFGSENFFTITTGGIVNVSTLQINSAFTFPNTDGGASQYLKTNGSGSLSWATIADTTAAGTDGMIQYNNGGTAFGGAATLYWDDVNGRLGIGIAAPSVLLQVGATAPFTTGAGLVSTGSAHGVIGQGSNWGLIGYNTGTPANEVDISGEVYGLIVKSGNVGIRTTTPRVPLDILTTSSAQLRLTYTDSSVYTDFTTNSAGDMTITPTSGNVVVGSGAEVFTVLSTGNVGMGTTNPGGGIGTYVLSIANTSTPPASVANVTHLYSSGGEGYWMDAAGNTTLQTPHDLTTGDWIFSSTNANTGRTLRVDMEQMSKFIDETFGTDFVYDSSILSAESEQNSDGILGWFEQKIKDALVALGMVIDNGIATVKGLFAEKVTTNELCVGETCVNEEQLKQILEGVGRGPTSQNLEPSSQEVGPLESPEDGLPVQHYCDEGIPELCVTPETCQSAGLYWYDDECHLSDMPSDTVLDTEIGPTDTILETESPANNETIQ